MPPRAGVSGWPLFLALLAFIAALVLQLILKAAGLESDHPVRILLTPLLAGGVVTLGMRRYPAASRLRMGLMVAAAIFGFALLT